MILLLINGVPFLHFRFSRIPDSVLLHIRMFYSTRPSSPPTSFPPRLTYPPKVVQRPQRHRLPHPLRPTLQLLLLLRRPLLPLPSPRHPPLHPLHRAARNLNPPTPRALQRRNSRTRAPPLALPALPPADPHLAPTLGRRRLLQHLLRPSDNRHGRPRVHQLRWFANQRRVCDR